MNIKKRAREKDGSERWKMREMGERASEKESDITGVESERRQHFLFFSVLCATVYYLVLGETEGENASERLHGR